MGKQSVFGEIHNLCLWNTINRTLDSQTRYVAASLVTDRQTDTYTHTTTTVTLWRMRRGLTSNPNWSSQGSVWPRHDSWHPWVRTVSFNSYTELENGAVIYGIATMPLNMPTVNDCHRHGSNSRGISDSVLNSTLHDAYFYHPWALATLHCCDYNLQLHWWWPLPVTVSGLPRGVRACALNCCCARSCTNKYMYIYTASCFSCICQARPELCWPHLCCALLFTCMWGSLRLAAIISIKWAIFIKQRRRKHKPKHPPTFSALYLINDPQSFAEKLFKKLEHSKERFEVRLMLMSLISRLVGLHQVSFYMCSPYCML